MVHRNRCNIITIEKKYISEYLLLTIKKKYIYVTCSVFHSRAKKANPIKNKQTNPKLQPFLLSYKVCIYSFLLSVATKSTPRT